MIEIRTVGIVGTGTMGTGIATNVAQHGIAVRLFDARPEAAEAASAAAFPAGGFGPAPELAGEAPAAFPTSPPPGDGECGDRKAEVPDLVMPLLHIPLSALFAAFPRRKPRRRHCPARRSPLKWDHRA
jgi:hypothetical protein